MSRVKTQKQIAIAAEMAFDGATQEAIAQKLGLDRTRISKFKQTDIWRTTTERLESLKQKAQAEAEKRQQLQYASESDRAFDQSRRMVQVCATTYSKLMLLINAVLDEAQSNPDKIATLEQIKNLPNFVKAALALQQEAFDREYDEIEALKVLTNAGWLPRSILKLANEQSSNMRSRLREALAGVIPDTAQEKRGITPETAASIRRLLLGIESSDVAEIPEEMD